MVRVTIGIASLILLFLSSCGGSPKPVALRKPAPDFFAVEEWINSGGKPLKMTDLRGKVVVLHFWAFG